MTGNGHGYVICVGACINCGRPFSFNPHKVPSVIWQGKREPVCRNCLERANAIRKARGIPEHEVLPGAYDPADEGEL